ncbi:energy transducer TonB [Hymenobacter sp. DG25A]|uniref:energy transducer TonB n=1 Tax=Hymenobacter sp. DG25A TaxID=1385663 RepID=UPI0008FF9696|nr:energy transducer TonB [Hymenobacter sp. DG25A]
MAMHTFISKNYQWPKAAPTTITGRVFAVFRVDIQGRVKDIRLINSLHPLLDAEVIRAVQLLDGRFDPARTANGVAVESILTIPVSFQGNSTSLPQH